MYCAVSVTGELMEVNLIFKIAAVGILITILGQVLKHSGREEHAFLISLAGLVLVLSWIVPYIYDLFDMIQRLLDYKESVKNVCGMYNGICRIVCCINPEKGQTGVCCICNCTDQFIACPSYHGGIRDSYGGAAAVGYSSWGEKTVCKSIVKTHWDYLFM